LSDFYLNPPPSDLDLDSTTAFRFHFGKIAISVAWRSMQILLIGASPEAV
jgi:hypothetical protein